MAASTPRPPAPGQRRFVTDLDGYATLLDGAQRAIAALPDARLGLAPHSLRAVTAPELAALRTLAAGRVLHIHVAEQLREVEDCRSATGQRPVEHLLATTPIDARWCIIHATHMTEGETTALAATGAVAGLCPITEADLGDGLFPALAWRDAGTFGIGTDSNTAISAAQELRLLEYGQRLAHHARTLLAPAGVSTGRHSGTRPRAAAPRRSTAAIGALAPGHHADIIILDPHAPRPGRPHRRRDPRRADLRRRDPVHHGRAGRRPPRRPRWPHIARRAILDRWHRTAGRLPP